MRKLIVLLAGWLALSASTQVLAVECPAARAMFDGEKEFNARLQGVQRQEWLLLEYLTSDGSQKSKEALAEEYGRNLVRKGQMADLTEEMKKMPADAPDIPEDGTPACEISTHVKETVYKFLDDREAELKKYYREGYLFIMGCDLLAVNLLDLGKTTDKPDSKLNPKTMAIAVTSALEPLMKAARMKPADLERLTYEMLLPSQLRAKTRYSYAALRCLRVNQGVEIQPLAAANEALAKCDSSDWIPLGKCVDEATRLTKQ